MQKLIFKASCVRAKFYFLDHLKNVKAIQIFQCIFSCYPPWPLPESWKIWSWCWTPTYVVLQTSPLSLPSAWTTSSIPHLSWQCSKYQIQHKIFDCFIVKEYCIVLWPSLICRGFRIMYCLQYIKKLQNICIDYVMAEYSLLNYYCFNKLQFSPQHDKILQSDHT